MYFGWQLVIRYYIHSTLNDVIVNTGPLNYKIFKVSFKLPIQVNKFQTWLARTLRCASTNIFLGTQVGALFTHWRSQVVGCGECNCQVQACNWVAWVAFFSFLRRANKSFFLGYLPIGCGERNCQVQACNWVAWVALFSFLGRANKSFFFLSPTCHLRSRLHLMVSERFSRLLWTRALLKRRRPP